MSRKLKKTKNTGECKLCGKHTTLTFEHVPPKATFNDFPWEEYNMDTAGDLLIGKKPRKKILQKGTGGHYLCSECNNKSGSNYVKAYIDFIYQIWNYIRDNSNEKDRIIKANFNNVFNN